jgi:hypothetical protein
MSQRVRPFSDIQEMTRLYYKSGQANWDGFDEVLSLMTMHAMQNQGLGNE